MQKKIPMRQCMGCRERKAKREMIRVVRMTDGNVSLDFSGKLNGRGAYICPDPECLKKARKSLAKWKPYLGLTRPWTRLLQTFWLTMKEVGNIC